MNANTENAKKGLNVIESTQFYSSLCRIGKINVVTLNSSHKNKIRKYGFI